MSKIATYRFLFYMAFWATCKALDLPKSCGIIFIDFSFFVFVTTKPSTGNFGAHR